MMAKNHFIKVDANLPAISISFLGQHAMNDILDVY